MIRYRRLNERLEGLNVQNGRNEYNAVGTLGSWTFNFVGDSDYTEEWYDDEWGGSTPYKEWRYTLDVKIVHEGDTKPLRYYYSSRSRLDFYDKAEELWQQLLDKYQSTPDLTQSDIINTLTSSRFRKFGI